MGCCSSSDREDEIPRKVRLTKEQNAAHHSTQRPPISHEQNPNTILSERTCGELYKLLERVQRDPATHEDVVNRTWRDIAVHFQAFLDFDRAMKREQFERQLRSKEIEHTRVRNRLQQEKQDQMEQNAIMQSTHTYQIAQERAGFETQLRSKQQTFLAEVTKLQRELDTTRSEAAAREAMLIEQHGEALNARDLQHRVATSKIRQQAADLHKVLMTQDQEAFLPSLFNTSVLPQDTDEGIKAKFKNVESLVEAFGRTAWTVQPEIWVDEQLEVARNFSEVLPLKHIKQALLQDMIWTVLFEYVFCSPFRPFGDLGRELEAKWKQDFSYKTASQSAGLYEGMPPASIPAERWRYMTLIGCRDALESALTAQDPRAVIKRGWQRGQAHTIREMESEVFKIVDPLESSAAELKHICDTAARIWLDLAMHRCRIEIKLMGSHQSAIKKNMEFISTGSLTLTKSPAIGRLGNAKGNGLETYTILSDSSGEALTLPYRG